jgi:hypothetical protein
MFVILKGFKRDDPFRAGSNATTTTGTTLQVNDWNVLHVFGGHWEKVPVVSIP